MLFIHIRFGSTFARFMECFLRASCCFRLNDWKRLYFQAAAQNSTIGVSHVFVAYQTAISNIHKGASDSSHLIECFRTCCLVFSVSPSHSLFVYSVHFFLLNALTFLRGCLTKNSMTCRSTTHGFSSCLRKNCRSKKN